MTDLPTAVHSPYRASPATWGGALIMSGVFSSTSPTAPIFSWNPAATGAALAPEQPLAEIHKGIQIPICHESTLHRSWFKAASRRLSELAQLPPNWNGYGERPVHPASIKRLVNMLDTVDYDGPDLTIVPLGTGALQVEWEQDGRYLEIEIPPTDDALACWEDGEDSGEARIGSKDAPKVRLLLDRLAG